MRAFTEVVCVMSLLICCMAAGDVLITNYDPDPQVGNDYYLWSVLGRYGYAVRITPDDGDATGGEFLPVASLTVPISDLGDQADLRLYLADHDGDTGTPGDSILGLFVDYGSQPSGGWDGDVTLAPSSSVFVQEGTSYWLVAEVRNPPAGGDGTAFYDWSRSTGTDPYGRIHETMGLDGSGVWSPVLTAAPAFQLLVPEPGGVGLLALAGMAGWLWRRRR